MGRPIFANAPEVTWNSGQELWQERQLAIEKENPQSAKIIVVPTHNDVTRNLMRTFKFQKSLSTMLPPMPVTNIKHSDGNVRNDFPEVEVGELVYLVSSVRGPQDLFRLLDIAHYLKNICGIKHLTGVLPTLGISREDKNVKNGTLEFRPSTIGLMTSMQMLKLNFDSLIVLEPHSSATQAYAAMHNLPVLPLSPWQFLIEQVMPTVDQERTIVVNGEPRIINQDTAVVIRPDKGRNLAATRLQEHLHLPGVAFDKLRIDGRTTTAYELSRENQELVQGKIALLFDDEGSSLGTMHSILEKLDDYGIDNLVSIFMHLKLSHGWQERRKHHKWSRAFASDSIQPIADPKEFRQLFDIISLAKFIYQIIEADMLRTDFWNDTQFSPMILQPNSQEWKGTY